MGVINVTPDSFSDGGRFLDADAAIGHGRFLAAESADIIDIGAESTRPGYEAVSSEDEWMRLAPVVTSLARDGLCLSVDTTKADVARRALDAGVQIVNDVWGLQADPDMADVVADYGARVVIMHNGHAVDQPEDTEDMTTLWRRFFDRSLARAMQAGIRPDCILLDPGIGFGKTPSQSIQAVRSLGILKKEYGFPVLLGLSRKSFLGTITGRSSEERLAATLAANLYGVMQGADILRVHDVREHRDALKTWTALEARRD